MSSSSSSSSSSSMPGEPIEIPDRVNMATWFLDARLDEGLAEKTAVTFRGPKGDEAWSYQRLVDASRQVTNLLRAHGLRIEDRVQLLLLDTPEFVTSYFGVVRAGCVAVPTNTWLKQKDYAYYVEYTRPRAVVVDKAVWPEFEGALPSARNRPVVFYVDREGGEAPAGTIDLLREAAKLSTEAETEPTYRDDFSTFLSSSGSTGNPKCVVHMHHEFIWNTVAYAQRTLGLSRDDVTLSAPKLFFGYALASNMLFPLSVGGSCVLIPDRVPADQYFELLERYQATQFVTVPTTIAKMVAAVDKAKGRDLSKLHSLISAGEALPPRVYKSWKENFDAEIYDGIGSAEMFHVYITNRPGDVKFGSLGKLVEGYSYELVDDENQPVAQGEIGTLVIKGPSAGAGYWRLRDKSRETFLGDAVKGGDKFFVDAEDYFWYCGRGDDMLKCSGVYVSPLEVEDAVMGHPAVREAGVAGYRDENGLEKAMAFVELNEGHAPSEGLDQSIIAHVRESLAAFKAPRRVEFVQNLPRTETGKIKRGELRKFAAATSDRGPA